ncbi:MAG TPA: COX aromatic rich motif-containing protein [Bacillota bacterium]|nr:COX aromatic rich motif-containing protein [Bacillota bacterium]
MPKNKKQSGPAKAVRCIALGIAALAVLVAALLRGHSVVLFAPKGAIANEQHILMLLTVGILLIIAIPALFLIYFTAWKYRESNTKAKYEPDIRHGKLLDASVWLIPGAFALVLALIMWPATHRLAPQKAIAAQAKPLTIQVVSLRWKWLFIYPDQRIATVNFIQIPVDRPVQFELTADEAPMSSFWVPNLSGMLYTMTGHANRLNLIANTAGDYRGRSGEINGAGFADMQFTARASSNDDFNKWVSNVQSNGGHTLDSAEYNKLLIPSEKNPTTVYPAVEGDLYDTILMKYMGGHNHGAQSE